MSAPNSNDFKALIPAPTSTLCSQFMKVLLQLPVKIWQWMVWFEGGDSAGGGTLAAIPKTGDLIFSAAPSATVAGRLLCDGSEVSKTTYANLYTAIGDVWGTAGSSANFKLPDFRARFPVGAGTFAHQGSATLGSAGGSDQQDIAEANLPLYKPGGLKTTPGTDKVLTYVNGTGDTKNGPGIGASDVQNAPELVLEDESYGAETPTALPTLPPFLPCYVYIIT